MKLFSRLTLTLVIAAMATALFAQESNINLKLGGQYPDAPNKAGFDSAIDFNFGADKYFTIGAEAGFGWVKWKNEGDSTKIDNVQLTSVDKTNIYSFPLLAVATIRLADMKEQYGFMPYLSGGAGYSWVKFDNPDMPTGFDKTFTGFTWQVLGGISFSPGSDSNMMVLIEGGWRSQDVENKDKLQLKMSGPVAHIGVSFPIGGSDY